MLVKNLSNVVCVTWLFLNGNISSSTDVCTEAINLTIVISAEWNIQQALPLIFTKQRTSKRNLSYVMSVEKFIHQQVLLHINSYIHSIGNDRSFYSHMIKYRFDVANRNPL